MRRNYPPPRRSSAGVRLVIPIAINTAATLSPRVHRRQSALRSLITSPRQLSGIMKARVACDRDLIKLGQSRQMIVKLATLHCVRRRVNETLQSDTKFYKPVGCAAVLTCGNLSLKPENLTKIFRIQAMSGRVDRLKSARSR